MWEHIEKHAYDTEHTLELLRIKLDMKWDTKDIKNWLIRHRIPRQPISIEIESQDDLALFNEADTQILEIILQSGRDWRNPDFLRSLSEILQNTTDGRLVLPMDLHKWFEKMTKAEKRNGWFSTGGDHQEIATKKNLCKVQLLPRRSGYTVFDEEISKTLKGTYILKTLDSTT